MPQHAALVQHDRFVRVTGPDGAETLLAEAGVESSQLAGALVGERRVVARLALDAGGPRGLVLPRQWLFQMLLHNK